MLSEHKTYRTRDGSRTGIQVELADSSSWPWRTKGLDMTKRGIGNNHWTNEGRLFSDTERDGDLIEEQPADRPFSYDACPMHADGRRRAVTRDGREVVLLCGNGPEQSPVRGWYDKDGEMLCRRADGRVPASFGKHDCAGDLLVPPPPKRVVWVNLYDVLPEHSNVAAGVARHYASQKDADAAVIDRRLGNRAYPIEIDGDAA